MSCDIVIKDQILEDAISYSVTNTIPFVGMIELTSECNARCPFCLRPPEDKKFTGNPLSQEEVKRVLDELHEMQCFFIEFTGGEPLMYPGFDGVFRYARKLGFAVAITTNGFLLNHRRIDMFREYGVFNILLSLHSVNEKTYREAFGVNRSPRLILDTIRKLVKYDIPLQISFTACKNNIDDFGDVLDAIADAGLTPIDISPTIAHERGDGDPINSLMATDRQVRQLYLNHPNYLMSRKKLKKSKLTCVAGRSLLSIDYQGNVHPCTIFEYPAGNIRDQSLKEIWYESPVLNKIRQIEDLNFANCYECPDLEYCEICMARNYSVTGNLLEQSSFNCRESRLAREAAEILKKEKHDACKTPMV